MLRLVQFIAMLFVCVLTVYCSGKPKEITGEQLFNGYDTMEEWGEHLVTIADCNACHTPKKMSSHGPVLDSTRLLSGHPTGMPKINIDRKVFASQGLTVVMDLTEWVGPWGISYSANLTPHETGTGNWTEAQFIYAIRNGKYKGLPNSRSLLPPMPWETYRFMTDGELKAIFAYLRTVKPISNTVPPPEPPEV